MSSLRHDTRARFSIEKYARVLAALQRDRASTAEQVLQRMGVDPAEWAAADAAWSTALTESKKRGQLDWALRFTSAFFKARGGVDAGADGGPVEATKADAGAPALLVPTYQLGEKAIAVESAAPTAPTPPSTGELDFQAIREIKPLPFASSRGPAPAPPKPEPRTSRAMSGTLEASSEELEAKLASLRAGPAQLALPMTVEKYVEMSCALAQAPDRNVLLQSKGFDPARWAAIQKAFATAFERDGELHKRYVVMMKNGLGKA